MPSDLQAELKQTRAFRSPEEEAYLSILRTAAVLEHAFEGALKDFGITATQYNVLRILRGAGPNGLCRNEIGERLIRRVPDVTRLLDRLEEMHLIARARGGDDRRFVTTRITPDGLKILERLDRVVQGIHDEQLGHLGAARLKTLIGLLAAVRHRS
jgi:DNA-binding MarR family transcriptional regulator